MKYIKIFIIAINIIGVISQYVLSLSRADNGLTISKLDRQRAQLEIENRLLKTELSQLSSIQRIENRAKELQLRIISSTTLSPITVAAASLD